MSIGRKYDDVIVLLNLIMRERERERERERGGRERYRDTHVM